MKRKLHILALLGGMVLSVQPVVSQYTGGSFGGYISSRSDDILYEGTTPITTGAELPDVVHNLTIDNPGGVTLSKSITIIGTLKIVNGALNLNGNRIVLGENATVTEVPGNTARGIVGELTVTRTLNNLTTRQNIAGLGLEIQTDVPLGETTITRGHASQQLTPVKTSSNRFFDVDPTNNANLDATVEFHYDESELGGIPEDDLALFISHDAAQTTQTLDINTVMKTFAATPSWQFQGGTVNKQSNTVCKGGVGDFSRLAIGRGYVFLAEKRVEIARNRISEGDIHCNGEIIFKRGKSALAGTHTGNLTAVGDILIFENNTIVGDAATGGDFSLVGNASVTGAIAERTEVLPLGLPSPSFSAGGPNHTVPTRGSLILAPGSYGKIEVEKLGTLFLSTGDYFMDILNAGSGAILSIDVLSGPVNINVVKALGLDTDFEIIITPLGQAGTNQVTFTTLQTNKLIVCGASLFLGWLIAPNAEVQFVKGTRMKGSVIAEVITLEEGVLFFPHSSSVNLQSLEPLEEEYDTDEEIISKAANNELAQNYPNPSNPSTTIYFSVKEAGTVRLSIYNLQGQEVRELVFGPRAPGQHSVTWDGMDNLGHIVPSGVYLFRLVVQGKNGEVVFAKTNRWCGFLGAA